MDYVFLKLAKRANEVNTDLDTFLDHYRYCINHSFNKL
jgi:hypothetical protein